MVGRRKRAALCQRCCPIFNSVQCSSQRQRTARSAAALSRGSAICCTGPRTEALHGFTGPPRTLFSRYVRCSVRSDGHSKYGTDTTVSPRALSSRSRQRILPVGSRVFRVKWRGPSTSTTTCQSRSKDNGRNRTGI